jgi:hypothetical protein
MAIRMKMRRGTQAEWSSENPVLRSGEIVVETDTLQVKIGNGTSNYNSLPYAFDPGDPAPNFTFF